MGKLVTADLSKRYGNLKAGSDDILGHGWFKGLDLKKMEAKEMTPPYKPQVKDEKDMSNYENIPDSAEQPPAVPASADPFVKWSAPLGALIAVRESGAAKPPGVRRRSALGV